MAAEDSRAAGRRGRDVTQRNAGIWLLLVTLLAVTLLVGLSGCGRDDLGALLVRWPF